MEKDYCFPLAGNFIVEVYSIDIGYGIPLPFVRGEGR